jgi:hypothetical protein
MIFTCESCWSNVDANAQFCGECGSDMTCYNCHVKLSQDRKNYVLSERSGCLVSSNEYCKECYKAKLIERANRKEMYEEAAKAAKAECNKCRKPFMGILRKKRYAVKGHGIMRNPTEYFCKDCFLALPKSDPWDGPPERITSDLWD